MTLGVDFFGISEELHKELSVNPNSENKKNAFAEFNREKNELKEYMNALHVLFDVREKYMNYE